MASAAIYAPMNVISDRTGSLSTLIVVYQALLATMVFTSLVSLMHAFMGGGRDSGGFARLESFQIFGVGLSVAALTYSLLYFARDGRLLSGRRGAWQHMPGWLVFIAVVLNVLALVGELSYALLMGAEELLTEWINHVALVCLASSSTAFLFLFAVGHAHGGGQPFAKERW